MRNSQRDGIPSDLIGDWPETPEPTTERRLVASLYLTNDLGITGTLEDVCYRLVVELAKTRKANKDIYDMMSAEVNRYKARFKIEHGVASDLIEENQDLEEKAELACIEADLWEQSFTTAQGKLENAMAAYDEIAPFVDWDRMLNDV